MIGWLPTGDTAPYAQLGETTFPRTAAVSTVLQNHHGQGGGGDNGDIPLDTQHGLELKELDSQQERSGRRALSLQEATAGLHISALSLSSW